MSSKAWISLCLAAALLDGCSARTQSQAPSSQPEPQVKPVPPTPIAEQKAELGDDKTWQPEWNKIVEDALPPALLSSNVASDVKTFCPRFNGLSDADKRGYWAYFFQALAGAEAGLNPTSNVRHTEPDVAVRDGVSHRMVRSEGLLQLTYEDSERYGCDFDWEKDKGLTEHDPAKTILQPKNNLLCGVKILENQLIEKRQPLLSESSYWSTLRPDSPSYRLFVKQMTNVPAVCRGTRSRRKSETVSKGAVASAAAQRSKSGVH